MSFVVLISGSTQRKKGCKDQESIQSSTTKLKAQPSVVLALKHLRRRGHGLKPHPTDWKSRESKSKLRQPSSPTY